MKKTLQKKTLQKKTLQNQILYTNTEDKPESKTPRPSMFISTSRLNRGQRKYCNCLMQVRTQKKIKPYAICKKMSYKIMQANKGQSVFKFNPYKTNCILNYDYSQYSLQDVQALARESAIPLHNPKTGNSYNKNTLIQLLTKRYINYHRQPRLAKT